MKRIWTLLGLAGMALFCSPALAGEGEKVEPKEGAVVESADCCGSHGFLHKLFRKGSCHKVALEIPLPSITLPSLPSFGCGTCVNPFTHLMDKIRSLRPCCLPKISLPCVHGRLSSLRCKLHALFRSDCSACGAEEVEEAPAPAPAPAPKPAAQPDNARRDGLLILTPAG